MDAWHAVSAPKRERGYWGPKIARNQERDAEQTAALEEAGWIVLRFWEHEGADAISEAVLTAVLKQEAVRRIAPRRDGALHGSQLAHDVIRRDA